MFSFLNGVLLTIFAYLFGSILFGEIVAKKRGIDIRAVGSGNVGATNVGRALGKKYAALVFFLDMLKGFLPAIMARFIFGESSFWFFSTSLAAVLGHMFSYRSDFRGGKGVATSFGVLFAASFLLSFKLLIVWVVLFYITKIVSVASIGASLLGIIFAIFGDYPFWLKALILTVGALVILKHKDNIKRILEGKEHSFKR